MIKIHCIGDSVTDGMTMDGHHRADYGKHSYPAWLTTLLTDRGYEAEVQNYGHGGERIAEVCARCGALPCLTDEELTLPGDGTYISLGKFEAVNGRVIGTKLTIPSSDCIENDRRIYFTQMSHDTNPVTVNGVTCTMKVENNTNFLAKAEPDGIDVTVPKGSPLFTANDRGVHVNIFYAGINDGANLTLAEYTDLLKKCGDMTGGKYIVLGSTHAIWRNWRDLATLSPEEKDERYRRECCRAFGTHFVDLYEEFARRGLDLALGYGHFSDKSDDAISAMREKLSHHIIPAEFTYNGENDGNVHLSKEGYYVIAELILERMNRLSYI